jgi:hypothetical protein
MLRKASMLPWSVSLSERPIKEVTTGLNRLFRTSSILLEYQQGELLMPKQCSTQWEEVWRRDQELPRCTSRPMETLPQVNRGPENMTGKPIQELLADRPRLMPLVMENKSF